MKARGRLVLLLIGAGWLAATTLGLRVQLRRLKREHTRVQRVAAHLGRLETVLRTSGQTLDATALGESGTMPAAEDGHATGVRVVRLHTPGADAARVQRYRSDLVLSGLYVLELDARGRFVDLRWDKP